MTPVIDVRLHGDGAFADLADAPERVIHLRDTPITIAALEGGMTSGLPSLCIRIDLPDGRSVLAETSVRAFQAAAAAIEGKFGRP